jgi:hypothetical protein
MQPVALAAAAPPAYGDTTTAALLASLAGAVPGAPVTLRGTVDNTAAGSVLEVKAGTTLGQVNLNGGTVRGGTLRLSSGALRFNADGAYGLVGTLDGVGVQGGLAVGGAADPFPGYGAVLGLRGGVTFAGPPGTGRGSVTVTGAASEVRALDAETLDHVDLRFIAPANRLAGQLLTTAPGTVLALGPDASLNVGSLLTLGGGGTFRNAGAVAVRSGGTLAVAPGTTLARAGGSLSVAAGGTLSLSWTGTAPLDGLAGAAIDGTLALSGPLSSTAYAAALGGVTGAGGVSFNGTLDNTGAALSPGASVAGRLTLSGVLRGGTVTSGTLTLGPATVLDGVALRGPVTLAGMPSLSIDSPPPQAFFRGGLSLLGASRLGASGAGPGALTLSRLSLQASDTERLDSASVRLADATLSAADGARLTLGAGLALDVTGSSALLNATNAGSITVENNSTLTVDGSFANDGALTLNLGSRLNLTDTTTAGLAALAGGAIGPGTVGLAPNAVWDNTGANLVLLAGSRLNGIAALNPTLKGGTVTAAGGSLGFTGTVVLDGVAWRGAFAPTARAAFQFRGASAVQGLGNARALIDLAPSGSSLDLSGALDNTDLRMAGGALSAASGPVLLGAGTTLAVAGGFSTVSPARGTASGLSNAGTVTQTGDADYAALTNSGTVAVSHGAARAGTLANTGLITLDAATLMVGMPAALGGTPTALGGIIAFLDPTARLVFGGGAAVGASLRDFQNGDSIDLQGLSYGPGLSISLQGNAVQVSGGGAVAARFGLSGGTYAADQFSLAADGAGGTLLRTTHRLSAPVSAGPGRDFDPAYYLAHNPDVAAAGVDPLQHYLDYGWKEGRDPNAYFSISWYLNQNPDVAAAHLNPLQHYEDYGWREGRDPGPNFSTDAYLSANPDVRAAGIDPLQHFLLNGRAEGRSAAPAAPHPVGPQDPLVDRAWYLAQHPDVAASGEDASAHYHRIGWMLGDNPAPLFDTTYYLKTNPDVAAAGLDPLAQFEAQGWRQGREPSLAFSGRQYLAANPDVAAAGTDPLAHYLAYGQAEGRPAFVNAPQAAAAPDPLIDRAFYFAQVATIVPASADATASYDQAGWRRGLNPDAFFDTSYYLARNPDVRAAGINPLRHYEDYGWKEGRDPSAAFSTNKYLAAYSDVRAGGADPLASFLATGQAQGRTAFGA